MKKFICIVTIFTLIFTVLVGCSEKEKEHVVKVTKEDKAVVEATDNWIKENIEDINKFASKRVKNNDVIARNAKLRSKEFNNVILEMQTSGLGGVKLDDHLILKDITKSDDDNMHSTTIHEILVAGSVAVTLQIDVYYKKFTDQYTVQKVEVKTIPNL
jgi:microcystin degradation protein MlrC